MTVGPASKTCPFLARLIIAGGGLAGGLTALALRRQRPDVDILLVEQGATFGGNHTWSFFETDVPSRHAWLLQSLGGHSWPDHEVRFPSRERVIRLGYRSIRSSDLDRAVRGSLEARQYRLGSAIAELGENEVRLASGETIEADAVIDARGPKPMPGLDLAWQKFVGRLYRYPDGHERERPTIMDATVDQKDGYRFLYLLPFSATEMLVEDTYYRTSPHLDREQVGDRVEEFARAFGQAETLEEETGVLPVLLGGRLETLWSDGPDVPRLGLRGGFFHPTTGYSLPDAVANAVLTAEQTDLSTPSLYWLLRSRAEQLWRERRYFQLLNRMLFRAAEPRDRYRVLQHFYRLPPEVISRFYGARLTPLDKLRILSGKPPVPIGRALAAMRTNAA